MRFLQAVSWKCPRCGWSNVHMPREDRMFLCDVCKHPELIMLSAEELLEDTPAPQPAP